MSSSHVVEMPGDLETQLVDLNGASIDRVLGDDRDDLEEFVTILFRQVERPRFNLGSGPPGRAD